MDLHILITVLIVTTFLPLKDSRVSAHWCVKLDLSVCTQCIGSYVSNLRLCRTTLRWFFADNRPGVLTEARLLDFEEVPLGVEETLEVGRSGNKMK